jgi:polyhydroxybutyrate depolymerase
VAGCSGSGAAPASDADKAQAPVAGAQNGTVMVKGAQRSYRLYVPKALPTGTAAPLVVAMHGGLGTPERFAESSRFDQAAEAHGFLVVYPEGVGRTWNVGSCCGQASLQNIDDVAFISALIDHLRASFEIDPDRVFATGHSNGAMMSFRLACELSDKIAAVAPVAGSLEIGSCAPSRPVAVLAIHGDADLNHPLQGGVGPNSITGVPYNSMANSMESLRKANGCSGVPSARREGEITTSVWPGCREGGHTEQRIIAGASHAWPGATSAGSAGAGAPSLAFDATEEVWRFFEGHGRGR